VSSSESRLLLREWIAVMTVCSMMGVLVAIAWSNGHVATKQLANYSSAIPEQIQLTIRGAVQTPGVYSFRAGISLREVLRQVHLLKEADRKALNLKRCSYASEAIEIPVKKNKAAKEPKKGRINKIKPKSYLY
jgi:hypothetical protein